jgi:hypothetical protein
MNRRRRISQQWRRFLLGLCGAIAAVGLAVVGYSLSAMMTADSDPGGVAVPSGRDTAIAPQSSGLAGNCGSHSGGPKDNAIASFYGESAYPWTREIRWNCVYNINDFSGAAGDRFDQAQNAAVKNGGGVIYFPAGTYNFTEDIRLEDGIVIRGEDPPITDAKSDLYSPPSKLTFPKYEPQLSGSGTPNDTAFKKILPASETGNKTIGIVNLDINRGAIALKSDIDETRAENVIIFGDRSNNVAAPDPNIPDLSFQEPWQRYSYRFATNIGVTARQNILVANNRINDNITDNYEQPGYKLLSRDKKSILTYEDGKKAVFHYGNHYGIVVNRGSKDGGFKGAATPDTEPGLFRKGIVIRDNWVYHTMRVAIHAAGEGLIIQNNQIRDEANKQWWLDPTGKREATGAVTLENRGIDWSGWNVIVDGNDYQVYRHTVGETGYMSVDGEGILIQECCGGTTVNGATITNNSGNAYIGLYKTRDIENVLIENNQINGSNIFVQADTNNAPFAMNDVKIINNEVGGSIIARGSSGGGNNLIRGNIGNGGNIKYSCSTVRVENNRGFEVEPCL